MSATTWVYRQTERHEFGGLWTVGFYGPDGWEPESDHDSAEQAAARVHYLNGGSAVRSTLDEALNSGDGSYRP
jgi:hypothetical protein